jgi:nucleoside-diphosphate-sugar epimerase
MRILVTGATGFVGVSLLESLSRGNHELYGLARSTPTGTWPGSVTFAPGDVTKLESLAAIPDSLDLVIHCAGLLGRWGRTWNDYYNTNVVGTRNIAGVCRNKGIRNLFHVSSGGAYARVTKYEQSKYLSERILESYVDCLRVVTVRPELLYGPGDRHVGRLLRAIQSKRFVIIGNGNSTIHPTFIPDFLAHMGRLIQTIDDLPSGITYSIAGPQMTWDSFVRTVCDHYHIRNRFPRIPTPIMRSFAVLNEAASRLFHLPMLINREQVYFFSASHDIDTSTTLLHCPTPLVEGLNYVRIPST